MAFILAAQRDDDVLTAFARYRTYLASVRDSLPASVFALASSDWYFTPTDHRCPHDAWLESATFFEPSSGSRSEVRRTALRIRLLGAYHDGFIEFVYPDVFRYCLDGPGVSDGHCDWRYDEFRLFEAGHVIHEIEWRGAHQAARWLIEASDVQFEWHPKEIVPLPSTAG